jgi:hypothetical protein
MSTPVARRKTFRAARLPDQNTDSCVTRVRRSSTTVPKSELPERSGPGDQTAAQNRRGITATNPPPLLALAAGTCRHHPPGEIGDPFFGDA